VTRPRAADDFATIRARMKELRRERAPRAADDFAAIRARMEELRRARSNVGGTRHPAPLPAACRPSATFSRVQFVKGSAVPE
jgi:hypothetical protein